MKKKVRHIRSFKDIEREKETTRFRILIAEKQIELKSLEIKHHFEPIQLISGLVNKMLESFFK